MNPRGTLFGMIDEVARTGNATVVIKNGRLLSQLVPHRAPTRSPLGIWRGKVIIKDDIILLIDVEWDALK